MMSFLSVDALIIFVIKSVGFGVAKSCPRPKMLISSLVLVDSSSIYYIFALMFHYLYRRSLAFSEFFLDFIS